MSNWAIVFYLPHAQNAQNVQLPALPYYVTSNNITIKHTNHSNHHQTQCFHRLLLTFLTFQIYLLISKIFASICDSFSNISLSTYSLVISLIVSFDFLAL